MIELDIRIIVAGQKADLYRADAIQRDLCGRIGRRAAGRKGVEKFETVDANNRLMCVYPVRMPRVGKTVIVRIDRSSNRRITRSFSRPVWRHKAR